MPPPFEGARLTDDHRVSLRVPDRPSIPVGTRWDLTYEEERDALTLAQEAAQAVESLVDGLIDAFVQEGQAVRRERGESV